MANLESSKRALVSIFELYNAWKFYMNAPIACKVGYLGSYHVDFPFLADLNETETARFYLKKAQLYQGYVPGVYKARTNQS